MHIEELPSDILLRVLAYVPYRDIIRHASLVSLVFQDICSHSSLWKYLFQLDFKVDLKNVREPDNWAREYSILQYNWTLITGFYIMHVDPDYEQMIDLHYKALDGVLVITNQLTSDPGDIITVQCRQPLRPLPIGDYSVGYFETTMIHSGDEQRIGIGLARKDYTKGMPGWKKGSCGYHADDGRFFISLDYGLDLTDPWKVGDICGCGIDFRRNKVFFTKNGTLLVTYPFPYITLGLYITIGTQRNGETVEVNFGGKAFVFDVLKHQENMRESAPYDDLTVPYSTLALVFDERPHNRRDQFEDLDYQDRYLALDSQMILLSSMSHLLTEFPNDSSSFKSKVERLLQQMESEDVNVPQNVEIDELRDALVKYINNKKLLRMYRLMDTPAHLNMLDALFDHYSCQILKCINVLSFNYPQDHLIVNYTYGVLQEQGLTPPDDTISNRRAFCRSLLKNLDHHLLQLKAQRRETLQKLPCYNPSSFYYNAVENLAEDIDNSESYDKQMQEYPFTPRQQVMLEHIADCLSNADLTDNDPLVETAIAQCYFEFRKAMPFIVHIHSEREELTLFLSQIIK